MYRNIKNVGIKIAIINGAINSKDNLAKSPKANIPNIEIAANVKPINTNLNKQPLEFWITLPELHLGQRL